MRGRCGGKDGGKEVVIGLFGVLRVCFRNTGCTGFDMFCFFQVYWE